MTCKKLTALLVKYFHDILTILQDNIIINFIFYCNLEGLISIIIISEHLQILIAAGLLLELRRATQILPGCMHVKASYTVSTFVGVIEIIDVKYYLFIIRLVDVDYNVIIKNRQEIHKLSTVQCIYYIYIYI